MGWDFFYFYFYFFSLTTIFTVTSWTPHAVITMSDEITCAITITSMHAQVHKGFTRKHFQGKLLTCLDSKRMSKGQNYRALATARTWPCWSWTDGFHAFFFFFSPRFYWVKLILIYPGVTMDWFQGFNWCYSGSAPVQRDEDVTVVCWTVLQMDPNCTVLQWASALVPPWRCWHGMYR